MLQVPLEKRHKRWSSLQVYLALPGSNYIIKYNLLWKMLTIIYPKDPSDVDSHSAPSLFIFVKNQKTSPSEYSWRIIFRIFLADYLPLQLQPDWRYQYLISNLKSVKNSSSPARAITSASPRYSSLQQKCPHINAQYRPPQTMINTLKPELNPICSLLALLGAHHFLHVSRIKVKLLTFRLLISYIYGAPILDVSRSHTTTQHSR